MSADPLAATSAEPAKTTRQKPLAPSQSLQPLSHHLCHSALSVPRTNTSSRFGDHDATAGPRRQDATQGFTGVPSHMCSSSAMSVPGRACDDAPPEHRPTGNRSIALADLPPNHGITHSVR
jgi:hypothetical protein